MVVVRALCDNHCVTSRDRDPMALLVPLPGQRPLFGSHHGTIAPRRLAVTAGLLATKIYLRIQA